jgi:hypothetical protein
MKRASRKAKLERLSSVTRLVRLADDVRENKADDGLELRLEDGCVLEPDEVGFSGGGFSFLIITCTEERVSDSFGPLSRVGESHGICPRAEAARLVFGYEISALKPAAATAAARMVQD